MKASKKNKIEYITMFASLCFFLSIFYGLIVFLMLKSDFKQNHQIIAIIFVTIVFIYMIYIISYHFFISILTTRKAFSELKRELSQINIEYKDDINEISVDKEFKQLIDIIRNSSSREYMESILRKQAQLDNLQSQINPHFLYNILDSVRGEVLIHGLKETAEMIESLSKFFRYGIGSSVSLITFEEEYENAENYMKIQQYRFGDRIKLISDFDMDDKNIMNFKLPKMTLQPLVENAINHGIEGQMTAGKIVIRVIYTNKRMLITVEDNGVGMDIKTLESINNKLKNSENVVYGLKSKGNGVALLNVSERIKLLFGNEFGIHINSTLGMGTEVHVSMPHEVGE